MDPLKRSMYAFCQGDRGAVTRSDLHRRDRVGDFGEGAVAIVSR
jgi:hypothetical protein